MEPQEASRQGTQATVADDELALDSTFFVAFDLAHRALKSGLVNASTLNVTQYRVLVRLLAAGAEGLGQSELAQLLDLKANVVTQAVSTLVKAHLAARNRGGDARVRVARITEEGRAHVAQVNASIVNELYATFPTEDPANRSILEAAIAAGARIDPRLSGDVDARFAASRALVSVELVKRAIEEALKRTCGASLVECRVLQRLSEVGEPLRAKDVARQLQLSPVAVARAVEGLATRGWVQRLASPLDRKAVYVATTPEGERMRRTVERTINVLACTYLWKSLDDTQRRALARTWHVVVAGILEREEAKRKAALGLLQPID